MSLAREAKALARSLPDDPVEPCRRLVGRMRAELPTLTVDERADLALAVTRLRDAVVAHLVALREEASRVGSGRRALRGYGHLRPQTRAQRLLRSA